MQVYFSTLAQADLDGIKQYIAKDKPLAAARWIRSIQNRIQLTIAVFPESGQACDQILPGLRRFRIGNYLVFYRVTHRVEIARVLHGARNIEGLFGP